MLISIPNVLIDTGSRPVQKRFGIIMDVRRLKLLKNKTRSESVSKGRQQDSATTAAVRRNDFHSNAAARHPSRVSFVPRKRHLVWESKDLNADLHVGSGVLFTGDISFSRYALIDGIVYGKLLPCSHGIILIRISCLGEVTF